MSKTCDDRTFHYNQIVRFSERLEKAMGQISKSELARRSGLSEASIRKYLKGGSYPTIDSAAKVADACGVSLNWLLTGEDDSDSHTYKQPISNSKDEPLADPTATLVSLLSFVGSDERQALATLACEIGIKGILDRTQRLQSQPNSAEEAIRALNIRESLKDAICMALPGDEYTDREILRGIESRARERSPDGSQTPTTPDDDSVKKTA